MKLNTKLHSELLNEPFKPTVLPEFQTKLKNKRKSSKSSEENANSTLEYGYDTQQDELEVKQQFNRYVEQDVYFN